MMRDGQETLLAENLELAFHQVCLDDTKNCIQFRGRPSLGIQEPATNEPKLNMNFRIERDVHQQLLITPFIPLKTLYHLLNPDREEGQRLQDFYRSVSRMENRGTVQKFQSGGVVFVTWPETDVAQSYQYFQDYKNSLYRKSYIK